MIIREAVSRDAPHIARVHGVGRLLTQRVATSLLSAEISTMLVWVLAANSGARRFYELLGGRFVREQSVEVMNIALPEVAYGWDALSLLVGP